MFDLDIGGGDRWIVVLRREGLSFEKRLTGTNFEYALLSLASMEMGEFYCREIQN